MSVAIVVDDQWEISRCVPWGARFAAAADESLVVAVLEDGSDETRFETLAADSRPSRVAAAALNFIAMDDSLRLVQGDERGNVQTSEENEQSAEDDEAEDSPRRWPVQVVHINAANKGEALQQFISQYSTSLLILPRHRTHRGLDSETPWEHFIYRRAPCSTILLCPEATQQEGDSSESIQLTNQTELEGVLAPVDDGRTSVFSLRWAKRLSESLDKPLTALYVEPEVGEVATEVGRRIVDRIVSRTLGDAQAARRDVIVGGSIRQAICNYAERGPFDLIVLGANRIGVGRRWMRSSISEWLMGQEKTGATVAVVRPPLPLAHRFTTRLGELLREYVPQLDREARISLFERVQSSSRWDFDFIALICLSTTIAALGLIQSSPAVVIGAMLVAPLMTPLVGAGLALVQGNRVLHIRAWGTVLRGFLLAFLLGWLIGWCIPGLSETSEMLARGSPNVLDLAVALIGGVAASYALGRPNLFSALPGVAIAAALVPPIATAGLAASLGNWPLAGGALLLFATNIVAIVLGTAISLFCVGIRGAHEFSVTEAWVGRIVAALIVVTSVIAAYEFVPHHQLPAKLQADVEQLLDAAGAQLHSARHASTTRVEMTVHSASPLPTPLRKRLADAVRKQLGESVQLEIETRLVTIE